MVMQSLKLRYGRMPFDRAQNHYGRRVSELMLLALADASRRPFATECKRAWKSCVLASAFLPFNGKPIDNKPRRGGRAAECGGLLIVPARFALTGFHVLCLH
jgi:hypothetical protein